MKRKRNSCYLWSGRGFYGSDIEHQEKPGVLIGFFVFLSAFFVSRHRRDK
jgi:hypothetical protein